MFSCRPSGFTQDHVRVCYLIDVGGAVQSILMKGEAPGVPKRLEALVSPGHIGMRGTPPTDDVPLALHRIKAMRSGGAGASCAGGWPFSAFG